MSFETYYLIINGARKARVVKPRWGEPALRPDETAFRLKIDFPPRRRVTGDIDLVISENVVTVDGVEMLPLESVIFTEPENEENENVG